MIGNEAGKIERFRGNLGKSNAAPHAGQGGGVVFALAH
jgi:hypothetical protein